MQKRILVISDSHGSNNLMMKIIEKEAADLVIHAGDYCTSLLTMKQYFHHFINGNNDYDWKDIDLFSYSGYRFLLIHGHQYWSWNETKWYEKLREFGVTNKADIVIFGHSHKDFIDTTHKPFLFNPGSISLPRKASFEKSYGIIEIDDKQNLKFKIKFA